MAIMDMISEIIAYETVAVVPIAAPVVRFSLISPVAVAMIITNDASDVAMLMPSRMPINMFLLMVKLLYRFCIMLEW